MKKSYLFSTIFCLLFFIHFLILGHIETAKYAKKTFEENKLLKNSILLNNELDKKIAILRKNRPNIGGDVWEIRNAIKEGNLDQLEENIKGIPITDVEIARQERILGAGTENYNVRVKGMFIPVLGNAISTCEYGLGYIWERDASGDYFIKSRHHRALDISQEEDTSVIPCYSGIVHQIIKNDPYFGNVVLLYHKIDSKMYISVYAHLEEVYVKEGEYVKLVLDRKEENPTRKSTLIGAIGEGGKLVTGRHLHWEVWSLLNGRWRTLNPVLNSLQKTSVKTARYKSWLLSYLKPVFPKIEEYNEKIQSFNN